MSRIEHENLFKQVDENARAIRRIETELRQLRERLEILSARSQRPRITRG